MSDHHSVLRLDESHHDERQDLKRSPGGNSERILGNQILDHHREHDRSILDTGWVLRRSLDVVRSDWRIFVHPDPAGPDY